MTVRPGRVTEQIGGLKERSIIPFGVMDVYRLLELESEDKRKNSEVSTDMFIKLQEVVYSVGGVVF